jgi:hypothetical protein
MFGLPIHKPSSVAIIGKDIYFTNYPPKVVSDLSNIHFSLFNDTTQLVLDRFQGRIIGKGKPLHQYLDGNVYRIGLISDNRYK